MPRPRPVLAILALALAPLPRAARAQPPQKLPPVVTTDTVHAVTVQNHRKVPVTVYMEYGQFDRRLGTVEPFGLTTLRLPGWAVQGRQRVRLLVHPEGEAGDLASATFQLAPPARLALVVPPRGGFPVSPDTMLEVLPPEDLVETTITVDNPRAVAVTVLAEHGPFAARLGVVPARSRATLRFPRRVVNQAGSVTLIIHPEGGRDLASQSFRVQREAHLGLRVPPR